MAAQEAAVGAGLATAEAMEVRQAVVREVQVKVAVSMEMAAMAGAPRAGAGAPRVAMVAKATEVGARARAARAVVARAAVAMEVDSPVEVAAAKVGAVRGQVAVRDAAFASHYRAPLAPDRRCPNSPDIDGNGVLDHEELAYAIKQLGGLDTFGRDESYTSLQSYG